MFASTLGLADATLLRLMRRYGVALPGLRPFSILLTLAPPVVAALAATTGAFLALSSPAPDADQDKLNLTLMLPVGVFVALVAAAPAYKVEVALDSPRSWALCATAGMTPSQFVWGRFALAEVLKAVLIVAGFLGFSLGYLLVRGPTYTLLSLSAVSAIATTLFARITHILIRVNRRVRPRKIPAAVRTLALSALIGIPALWLASRATGVIAAGGSRNQPEYLLLTLANGHMAHAHLVSAVLSTLSAIAILSTIACSHRLRGLTWADVVENCFALRPPYIDPPTLPGRSTSAVLVVDARRLARSARLRLKPLSNLFPLLVVVLLGPVIWRLTNGPIALPSALRPNRGEFAAGGAAMFAYTATIATASVFAMDADRHALTLWQTIPGGVRTVARARAIASSAVSVTVGVLGAVVLAYSFGLTAKEFVWCLLAAGAVAVVGTVLDLTASLRWPQLDWVEATEIGTSNGPRWVLRMTSGIPIVGAVAVVRLLPAPLGQLESIIFALLILAAVPLLAGCITAAIAPFSLRNANA